MKLVRGSIAGGLFAVAALLAACADSDEPGGAPTPGEPDGAVSTMPEEAGTSDTDADASEPEPNDAGADAAPSRMCSSQNFCHTGLPKGQLLRAVWGDGQGTVWAVSAGGSILRWNGSQWLIHVTNAEAHYSSIWGSSPTDIWVGGNGKVLHGTGTSASTLVFAPVEIPPTVTVDITAFWAASAEDIWAVGGTLTKSPASAKGCLLHYSGGVWTVDDSVQQNVAYTRIWGTPSTGLWIGGNTPTTLGIFRRAPGASTFSAVALPAATIGTSVANPSRFDSGDATTDTTVTILGAVKTTGFFGRTTPQVWRGTTADGGATFSWTFDPRPLPEPAPIQDFALTALWVKAPNDMWAAGASGRLQHWDGTAWTQAAFSLLKVPDVTTLSGIWGKDSTDFWVVGDNLALHKVP